MEEILEKIGNEIKVIKGQQKELENLAVDSEKIRKEEEELKQEQKTIGDSRSGFYKDLSEQIDEKHIKFIEANNSRMNKEKEVNQLISDKKEEIKKEITAKKQYIDENRNVNLKGIDLITLKAEKERLDKEIELNNITKDEFLTKSDSEKREIRKAKENYLNNKHRLNEINPIIELADTLDGKTPKEKFIELDQLGEMIEANFNKDNFDKILEDIENRNNAKNEEIDQKKLLNEMIYGREKREQERYDETIREAMEEERIKKQQENKEQEDEEDLVMKEKINGIEKEWEEANKDYKNIHLTSDRKVEQFTMPKKIKNDKIKTSNGIYIESKMNKIIKISIDEKEGIIYAGTVGGKVFKESLQQALREKKNLYNQFKIKEKCKEIAGGRIKGLLLGTKVNPAIVYELRNDPEAIETYLNCLQKQVELPFELSHDLRNSKLGRIDKLKMWVHAKAEDKIPGTRITFAERFWNKNKTLDKGKDIKQIDGKTEKDVKVKEEQKSYEPIYKQVYSDNLKEGETKKKSKPIDAYKQENLDNHIERNATDRILEKQQEKTAMDVQRFTGDIVDKNNNVIVEDKENSR